MKSSNIWCPIFRNLLKLIQINFFLSLSLPSHETGMFVVNAVIFILLATKFGHNFPIIDRKLPSTYDGKECPPGFLPCVSEKENDVPDPVRGSTSPNTTSTNTTSTAVTDAPISTASPPRNHTVTVQPTTRKASSGENMGDTWDSKDRELQHGSWRHECPPGIWVC